MTALLALLGQALSAPGTRGVEAGLPAPAGLERAYASRRVALVVGIDQYDDPALGDLKYAAKDAADMAAVLRDPSVGGYDVVSVVSGEVTKAAFWEAWSALAATIQRDDTVLVYLAGHGTLDLGVQGLGVQSTELYLLPSDAWLSQAAQTGIRVEALAEALASLPARRTVMVLDACYSGTGRSALAPEVTRKLERLRGPVPSPRALAVSEFSAHLYAAHLHQPSIEDPALENGVYTHFFVEALQGQGDADGDGLVEVMEAHGYARDRTLEHTGGSQVPWAETVSVGREALYLAGDPTRRRAAEEALLLGLEGLPEGASVTVDGLARGAGPLLEGRRQIEVRYGEHTLLTARTRVQSGDRIDLSEVLDRSGPQWLVSAGAWASADREILGLAGSRLALGLSPRDRTPHSGRLELWALGSVGPGPERPAGERFPAGTALGAAGWAVPLGSLSLSARLGAGFAWRLPAEPGPQASILLQPGASLRWGHAVFAELGVDTSVLRADRAWAALPEATFSLGLRPNAL